MSESGSRSRSVQKLKGRQLRFVWKESRRFLSPVLLVLVWQIASAGGFASARILPSPVQLAHTAWGLIKDGSLPTNLLVSLERASVGFGLALGIGVILALISGLSRLGEDIIDAPLQILRTLPALALAPLFILWFGI